MAAIIGMALHTILLNVEILLIKSFMTITMMVLPTECKKPRHKD